MVRRMSRASLRVAAALFILLALPGDAHAGRPIGTGAWSYFGDPRAVHVGGRTFVGWADTQGYTHVMALDHNRVIEHQRLGPPLSIDDHNNPSLYVRGDGRIMVFYSAHNGKTMYYRVSERPRSISRFSAPRAIGVNTRGPLGYTYPNPLRVDGRLWLVFRGANWQPSYTIQGDRWSPARTLVRGPVSRMPRTTYLGMVGHHRPYTKYDSDGERIHGVFTEGNLNEYPNSIYYAAFDRSGFYDAAGRRIARLGSSPPVRKLDRVRAYSGYKQWALDIAASPFGPIIVYMRRRPRPEFWWARYDGTKWLNFKITEYARSPRSPGAVGGATLDHENPSIVYLSRVVAGRTRHDVEVWQTPDGGETWNHRTLTRASTDDLRPITPRGLTDYNQVFWLSGNRTHWTSFSTRIFTATPSSLRRAVTGR